MNTTVNADILSYLQHDDCSLAVRRMLDMTLDIGDPALTRRTIAWSQSFRKAEAAGLTVQMPATFFEEANRILETAAGLGSKHKHESSPLLDATDISKRYSNSMFSLKPISLRLKTGDVLGVVGENGNGKTTLLRMLGGQLALDNGNIRYHLLDHPDEYAIKNHVAFIPQRIPRWYGLLKDNLHFSAAIAGVHGEENELMVNYMLERLNLSAYAHLDWNRISSGYRTRFEIARILLQKPRLLILDEPLANLDIKAQQTILTDLIYIAKGSHNPMGIILSSQQLHEVEKVADSVLFIKQGQCMYNSTNATEEIRSAAVEFETKASREEVLAVLGGGTDLHYNGGFYTAISAGEDAAALIKKLVGGNISITYFRDITFSTKRFFN